MTFAPADAAKISGPEAFYKAPFLSGQLQRLDANRFSLQLTSP
jgi:hypothetical protein